MCKVSHGGIVVVDIPFDPNNPHEHHSTHYYCIVSNEASCKFSPVINAIPLTSRCKKVELPIIVFLLAEMGYEPKWIADSFLGMTEDSVNTTYALMRGYRNDLYKIKQRRAMSRLMNAVKSR